MTTVKEIWEAIDRMAPFDTAEDFDNVGLLIGAEEQPVSRCLVTLDVTAAVAEEAVEKDCQLILSHHPVIFHPLRQIAARSVPGMVLRHGLSVISAHTNLDKAMLNPSFARKLGVEELEELPGAGGCVLMGRPARQGLTASELAGELQKAMGLSYGRLYDAGKPVNRVAVCCGGGGGMLDAVLAAGVDCYITGDIKHDQVVTAANAGLSIIDLGHFETEVGVIPLLIQALSPGFPGVSFLPAERCQPLFQPLR